MKKKICVIVTYNGEKFVQKEVVDLLLEQGRDNYCIENYISLSPSDDKHKNALFHIESFCNWLLQKCVTQHDAPFYIDEYLHSMIDKWYNRKQ